MAKEIINIGTTPNKGDGDPLRTAFSKINSNFSELYTLVSGSAAELEEISQDYAAAMFTHTDHTNITVTYDDTNDKIVLSAANSIQNVSELNNDAGYITDYTVTESDVTQHQAALSITESQITDLQAYLTAVTESDVTQHQAALSITESQITDLQAYLTAVSESDVTQHQAALSIAESQISDLQAYLTSVSESDVTQHEGALSITESQISDLQAYLTSVTGTVTGTLLPDTDVTYDLGSATNRFRDLYLSGSTIDLGGTTISVAAGELQIAGVAVATQNDIAPETLTITESQISDLGTYLTAEVNDLTSAVTWANIPDANVPQSAVTQHQAALSITESQISDFGTYEPADATILKSADIGVSVQAYDANIVSDANYAHITVSSTSVTDGTTTFNQYDDTALSGRVTTLENAGYITGYTVTEGDVTQHQTALSITESQISDLGAYLTAEVNDLTASVTWANIPDANVPQSAVTQHQAALSITESQISDLGTYVPASEKGAANGVATLDGSGLVPASQLPSYVDDVLEYADFASFPATGETGKIYVDIAESDVYRWTGSAYVKVSDAVSSSDQATKLATARNFSLTGDVTATAVSFDGTGNVALATSVTQSAVTQHEGALSITESQISDLQSYLTAETDPVFTAHTTSSVTDGTGLLKNDGAGNWSYDNSTYLTSYTETNDLTAAVTWANVPDANITQSSVTQHQAALSITESQISDLQAYLTAEVNDLTSAVTWANIPDANVPQSAVTQHQAALSITESQISDLGAYLTTESDPVFTAHTTASITDGTGFLKNDGAGNWSYDNSTYLTAEVNDLTSAVTWANVPDANITQSSVTQHQAALSITESQISDLGAYLTAETDPVFTAHTSSSIADGTGFLKNDGAGNWSYDNSTYLTSYTETNDLTSAVTWANVPDANITQSSVTQHQAALSITESQISDLGTYLTDLTGSSVGTLSDVNFNSVTLDGSNGAGKVLAWDQTLQAFAPVDQSGGISNVVEDTTPQLGGNLDTNGNSIGDGGASLSFNDDGFGGLSGDIIATGFQNKLYIQRGSLVITDGGDAPITISAPSNAGAGYTLTLPTNAGSSGQVLKTDGSGALSFAGQNIEDLSVITIASGVETHNLNNGSTFYHVSISGNITCNFTNVDTTDNRTTSVVVIIPQGGTAYMPTGVQIDSVSQTVQWQGGSAPSGTANGTDIVTFTLIRVSSTWTVIGSAISCS